MKREDWMFSFAGTRPEELAGCKVLSVRDRVITPRKRQTVERGGIVLASAAVPTLRQITAELLFQGRNDLDLIQGIRNISEWLEQAGEGRLSLRTMPGRYYLAECTEMSLPEIRGTTARVTLTFECTDYRQYLEGSRRPVEGADPESENFTFNGLHCLEDMGCMFVLEGRTVLPQISPHTYEILGQVGTLRYDDDELRLSEMNLSGTLHLVNPAEPRGAPLSRRQAAEQAHRIASWLVNARRAELVFDANPARTYQAEVLEAAEIGFDKWANGTIRVKFTLQPVSLSKRREVTKELTFTGGVRQDLSLTALFEEGLGYKTPLVVELTPHTRAVTEVILTSQNAEGGERNMSFARNGFSLAPGKTLRIDGEEVASFLDGENAARFVASGDYPATWKAESLLGITLDADTGCTVRVSARARWLG